MKTTNNQEPNKRDFKRLFNMNNILTQVVTLGAYIILIGSILVLTYLSFVERFEFSLDWRTLGIFSGATVALAWACWNIFYRKQYEKIMSDDINQQELNKYSIHSRYYMAVKDWSDADLQIAIDKFNDEYTEKWLRWVEKKTGKPIETIKEVYTDPDTFEETVIETTGIKDLPYKGFKHKILMWRIKNHKYPESGYKTSMELMSLFSFQDANFNKRNLRADKRFYVSNSIKKLLISILMIVTGASLLPEMIDGEIWAAVLKLALAIGSLLSATFMGAISGVKGARLKLSVVEDACSDLERWAEKKPVLAPYKEPEAEPKKLVEKEGTNEESDEEVTTDIFNKPKLQK